MKSIVSVLLLSAALCVGAVTMFTTAHADDAAETPEKSKAVLESEMDRYSYAIGVQVGGSIMQGDIELNPEALTQGIIDVIENKELALSDMEIEETMMALQQKMMEAHATAQREEGGKNLTAAQAFLAENADAEGVITLDSGLQYRVLTEGSGDKPQADSQVRVHYRGTLLDGTQFDSSYDRGEPAQFQANQVIQGWQEALQMMPVGSKWQLFVPPNLAYGEAGRPSIPANSLLIFEVELLEIVG